jgi:hypothetical protein
LLVTTEDVRPARLFKPGVNGYWFVPVKTGIGWLAPFIFLEIVDESANGSTCSSSLSVKIFELAGRYVEGMVDQCVGLGRTITIMYSLAHLLAMRHRA